MLKGSWPEKANEKQNRPALGMGRVAPSSDTDEAIKGACYMYGSLNSVMGEGDGHWLVGSGCQHEQFRNLFSIGVITIVQVCWS